MADSVQVAKAEAFRALHDGPEPLVLVNASDAATARIVVEAGYPAVATSSAGIAWLLGYADGENIPREEMLWMVRRIAERVDVPVTADMEAGYGTRTRSGGRHRPGDDRGRRRRAQYRGRDDRLFRSPARFRSRGGAHRRRAERRRRDRRAGRRQCALRRVPARRQGRRGAGRSDPPLQRLSRGRRGLPVRALRARPRHHRGAGRGNRRAGEYLVGRVSPPISELKRLGVARVSIGGLLSLAFATLARNAAAELGGPGTYGFAEGVILHPEMNALMAGE